MEIEEISDDDSSEDQLTQLLKSKKNDVPEEFSIDNLLKARVQENSVYNNQKNDENDEKNVSPQKKSRKNDKEVINIASQTTTDDDLSFPITNRDGSIFEFSQTSTSVEVFSFLEKDDEIYNSEKILSKIPSLAKWQYKTLFYHPALVEISSQILFSTILYMIDNNDEKIGDSIIKYWNRFPDNSIEYNSWYALIKKCVYSKFTYGTIILLTISDPIKFKFENEEEFHRAPFDIIVLHFYATFSPEIACDHNYRRVIPIFRKILTDNDTTFSEKQFEELVDTCYSLASDCDPRNSSYLISLFPIDGLGCELIIQVMMRLCLTYLRIYELPDVITVEFLAKSLSEIKKLCESLTDEDLINASASMALAERILSIAIKMKAVKTDVLEKMSKNMKFSINCANPGVLTALKEQIHVTRSQFDCFMQAGLL